MLAAAAGGAAGVGKRVSGLQHEVFALYRAVLRAAKRKDPGTFQLARAQFRQDAASVRRSDFQKVEFLLRHGRKQLKYLTMPGVGGASFMTTTAPSPSSAAAAPASRV